MRKILSSMLALAVLVGVASRCPAAEGAKTLAVVSFSGYDAAMKDIGEICAMAGHPELAQMADMMVKQFTQNKGLEGFDAKQPWGLVAQVGAAPMPVIYGFLPVSDPKKFLAPFMPMLQGASLDNTGGGSFTLKKDDKTLFLKTKGNWTFIAQDAAALSQIPDDPVKLLGDLNKKYLAAVSVRVDNIPPMFRQMALSGLQAGAEAGMQKNAGEDEAAFAVRKAVTQRSLQAVTTMINDLEELTYGLSVDSSTKKVALDVIVTAKPSSQLAQAMAEQGEHKTAFSGMQIPGAMLTAVGGGKLSAGDIDQFTTMIEGFRAKILKQIASQGLPEEQAKKGTQIIGDVFDVFKDTIKAGHSDGGAVVLLSPKSATLVAGGLLVNGTKLEKALKDLVAAVGKEEPDAVKLIKLDAEAYKGIHFHTVAVPVPQGSNREKVVKLVGENLDLVIGISDQKLYVAAGRSALAALKQVIDKSEADGAKAVSPLQLTLALSPLVKAAAELADASAAARVATLTAALEQSAGKDHLNVTSSAVPRGARVRLEMEEGVVRLLGALVNMKVAKQQ